MNVKTINALILAASAALLSSCLGGLLEPKEDPTRFYIISAAENPARIAGAEKLSLNLLPITAPAYMARNQIVSLDGDGSVILSEFDRWAESPQNGFTRAIIDNISSISGSAEISAYPFCGGAASVRVLINECVGKFGGELAFRGRWQADCPETGLCVAKDFSYKVPCGGSSCREYVGAISKAVYSLSLDIAETLSKNQKTKK